MIVAATAATAALAPPPCPRTFADCVDGARAALRHARSRNGGWFRSNCRIFRPMSQLATDCSRNLLGRAESRSSTEMGSGPSQTSFFEATTPNLRD